MRLSQSYNCFQTRKSKSHQFCNLRCQKRLHLMVFNLTDQHFSISTNFKLKFEPRPYAYSILVYEAEKFLKTNNFFWGGEIMLKTDFSFTSMLSTDLFSWHFSFLVRTGFTHVFAIFFVVSLGFLLTCNFTFSNDLVGNKVVPVNT